MPEQWDDDIAALSMSDVEKNGLQIYRNYSRAFENDLRKKFVAGVDKTKVDIEQLKSVMGASRNGRHPLCASNRLCLRRRSF